MSYWQEQDPREVIAAIGLFTLTVMCIIARWLAHQ